MKRAKFTLAILFLVLSAISGWSQTPCPDVQPPLLSANPNPTCNGGYVTLVAQTTGLRALVLYSHVYYNDGGITAFLNGDTRFATVATINARFYTPSLAELLQYDVVINWSEVPYQNNIMLGNNMKDYADAGGGVVMCFASFDPGAEVGLAGSWLASGYNPIVPVSMDVIPDTATGGIGYIMDPASPVFEGVSTVNPGWYYPTSTISAGSIPLFYWGDGYIGGAIKDVGSTKVISLNQGPLWDSGGDENLIIANAACWAAGKVFWYADDCDLTFVGSGKTMTITATKDTAFYAKSLNMCGSVSTCNSIAINVNPENCLDTNSVCSYVILVQREAKFDGAKVYDGGVGARKAGDGKIEAHNYTEITGSGTFAKAAHIPVDLTSIINNKYFTPANLALPLFEHNPYNANNNVNIPDNGSATLNGSTYKEVKIGKNATAIFTQPNVYLQKITMEDNSNLNFTASAKVHILDGIMGGKNLNINTTGLNVIFYIEQDVEFKEGDHVTGAFYLGAFEHGASKLKYRFIFRESKLTRPGLYNGVFLSEIAEVKRNNYFYVLPNINFCTSVPSKKFTKEETSVFGSSETMVKNAPNPFTEKTTLFFTTSKDEYVKIEVYDLSGKWIQSLYSDNANSDQEYAVDFDGTKLPAGAYIYRMTTDNATLTGKMILLKE